MGYLFLAILSSSSIAWLFKISEGGNFNRYRVTTANYGVAFFVSIFGYILSSLQTKGGVAANAAAADWLSVLGIGIPAGLCFFLSFVFYQKSVKENGASLSGMFGKLGILMPMLISVIVWRELPSLLQAFGIFIAVAAMIYVNAVPSGEAHAVHGKTLILLFIAGGMAEFSSKLFQKLGQEADKGLFLFVVFFVAFCFSFVKSCFEERGELSTLKKDVLMGAVVGIPNLLSSYFLISALGEIPATVAFPIYSSGAIALISIGSRLFFRERLGKRHMTGLALTMIALVLVNI